MLPARTENGHAQTESCFQEPGRTYRDARDARLVVEVDGYAFHADATAFEQDRQRDFALTSTGLRVVRVTWKQLVQEPEVILVRLAQSLVQR